jgi:hypothetical protein
MSYTELLPKPDPNTVKIGLKTASRNRLIELLGEPRSSYTGACNRSLAPS